MVFLEQKTGFSVRLWLYHNCSNYGFSLCAIVVLCVSAVLSVLVFIDTLFIEVDRVSKPISSALLFRDRTIDDNCLPLFYGYRISLWFDFGSRLAQHLL